MTDIVEDIVRFIRDHQPEWKLNGDKYDQSYYNRRNQLLDGSQKYHDEQTLWWIDQTRKHLNNRDD